MNIRSKIILSLLSVSLGSIIIVGLFSFFMAKNYIQEAHLQHLRTVASAQQNSLQENLTAWIDRVNLISSRTQLRLSLSEYVESPSENSLKIMERILQDAAKSVSSVKNINLCTSTGENLLSVPEGDNSFYDKKMGCALYLPESKKRTSLKKIWIENSIDPYVLLTGPIHINDKLIGIIHVILRADELNRITNNYNGLGKTGETILAMRTKNGKARFLTKTRHRAHPGLEVDIMDNGATMPIAQTFLNRQSFTLKHGSEDYRGVAVMAATQYLPGLDWGIVTKIDLEEVLTPIQNLLNSIVVFCVAAFFMIIVVGMYVGYSITKPILHLAEKAKKIKSGDLSQRVNISSKDEIGLLAKTFNEMTSSLLEQTEMLKNSKLTIEKKLYETESIYKAILDNAVDGIITYNDDGIIQIFNPECERIFGYSAEAVVGRNINRLLMSGGNFQEQNIDPLSQFQTSEAKIADIRKEIEGRKKDGSVFPMDISIGEVQKKENNEAFVRVFVGILRDISTRKKGEEKLLDYTAQLKASNKELDDFVYIVSHDLKEPLRGIYSFSQFLLEDYEDKLDQDGQNKLETLKKLSCRMENLIDTLLEYSRLGRTKLAIKKSNLNHVLQETLELIDPIIDKDQVTIKIQENLPSIVCDKARVNEIFRNLIMNAIKYNENDQKLIEVGYKTDHPDFLNRIVFFVKDNGIGISKKHHDTIFKMFKRLHQQNSYGGGTGSGLTIAKKIVKQHNGEIWVDSDGKNGSTFYFTLRE